MHFQLFYNRFRILYRSGYLHLQELYILILPDKTLTCERKDSDKLILLNLTKETYSFTFSLLTEIKFIKDSHLEIFSKAHMLSVMNRLS